MFSPAFNKNCCWPMALPSCILQYSCLAGCCIEKPSFTCFQGWKCPRFGKCKMFWTPIIIRHVRIKMCLAKNFAHWSCWTLTWLMHLQPCKCVKPERLLFYNKTSSNQAHEMTFVTYKTIQKGLQYIEDPRSSFWYFIRFCTIAWC